MAKIAIIMVVALQVVLPCVMSEEALEDDKARFLPGFASAAGGGGAFGNQHDKGQQSNEVHNDKQFSLDFGKKQGSSSQQSHDRGQQFGAAGGGFATAPVYHGGWGDQGWGRPPHHGGWGERPPHHGWGGRPPHHGWGGWGGPGR